MKNIVVICLLTFVFLGCRPLDVISGVKLSPPSSDELSDCATIADTQLRADCYQLSIEYVKAFNLERFSVNGSSYITRFAGQPMTINLLGGCLVAKNGAANFEDCSSLNPTSASSKFHFIDVDIKYKLKGIEQVGKAFHIVTRDSLKAWVQHDPERGEATPALQCLGSGVSGSMTDSNPGIPVEPCSLTSPMWLTIPNGVSGDQNIYVDISSRWSFLVALDLNSDEFRSLREMQSKENPQLIGPCELECLRNGGVQTAPVDLGELNPSSRSYAAKILNRPFPKQGSDGVLSGGVYYAGPKPGDASLSPFTPSLWELIKQSDDIFQANVGSCDFHYYNAENDCYLDRSGNQLSTHKKYYDYLLETGYGNVVYFKENGKCVLWDGTRVDCNSQGIDNAEGSKAMQYRLTFVGDIGDTTETWVQLQRVVNSIVSEQVPMCYDIKNGKEVKCCFDSYECAKDHSYHWSGPMKIQTISGENYDLNTCSPASTQRYSTKYDCFDYVDPKYKKYNLIADWLEILPIIGTIPAYTLRGMVCTSDEVTVNQAACLNLAISVAIDVMLLPLDFSMMNKSATIFARELTERGLVKKNFDNIADLVTDPVFTMASYRMAKSLSKKMVPKVGAAAAKELTPKVTEKVARETLKTGILGTKTSLTFSKETIGRLVRVGLHFWQVQQAASGSNSGSDSD